MASSENGDRRQADPTSIPLEGRWRVEASAGTGKTFAITQLVLRCLVERALSPEQILVVTFSNKATAELKGRIREGIALLWRAVCRGDDRAGTDPLIAPLLDRWRGRADLAARVDAVAQDHVPLSVFSIHGFCLYLIDRFPVELGASATRDLVDGEAELRRAAHDFWMRFTKRASPGIVDCLQTLLPASGRDMRVAPDISRAEAWLIDVAKTVHAKAATVPVALPPLPDGRALDRATIAARSAFEAAGGEQGLLQWLTNNTGKYNARRMSRRTRPRYVGDVAAWFARAASWEIPPVAVAEEAGVAQVDPQNKRSHSLWRFTTDYLRMKRGVHPFVDAVDAWREEVLAVYRGMWHVAEEFFAELDARAVHRVAHNRITYDDMVAAVHGAVVEERRAALSDRIAGAYRAVLIDEFQDTDPRQYAIFKHLFFDWPDTPVFLVGDPKQAIYGFRGGDVYTYHRAVSEATNRVDLPRNYRSHPQVLRFVNGLFAGLRSPFVEPEFSYTPVEPGRGDEVQVHLGGEDVSGAALLDCADPHNPIPVVDMVAQDVVRLLDEGVVAGPDGTRPVQPEDIAVLVRTHDAAKEVVRALQDRNVRAWRKNEHSVYGSRAAAELRLFLHAACAPDDASVVLAALATVTMGWSGGALAALSRDTLALDAWCARFSQFADRLRHLGVAAAVEYLLRAPSPRPGVSVKAHLAARMHGIALMDEWESLLADLGARLGVGVRSVEEFLSRYEELMIDAPMDTASVPAAENAVTVMTAHASKGLEFPVVIYAGVLTVKDKVRSGTSYSLVYHDDEGRCRVLPRGVPDVDYSGPLRKEGAESLSEDMRLLYVALTRAKLALRLPVAREGDAKPAQTPLGQWLRSNRVYLETDGETDPVDPDQAAAAMDVFNGPFYRVEIAPSEMRTYHPPAIDAQSLVLPARTRGVLDASVRASFSSLARLSHHEVPWETVAEESRGGEDEVAMGIAAHEVGTWIHHVFENRWRDPNRPVEDLVHQHAERFGIRDSRTIAWTIAAAKAVWNAQLGDFRLADAAPERAWPELQFVLSARARGPAHWWRRALEDALRTAARPWEGTAEGTVTVSRPLRSLVGVCDLVLEHGGRWYLLDYKTNTLHGEDPYGHQSLRDAVLRHRYHLQYHLYLVGVLRWLRLQNPRFDYETDFGGVFYLFVRGLAEGTGGVFFDKPPAARIAALDALFASGGEP